eukprot:63161-Prorocentrum_minimum.AAC.1
MAGIPPIPPIPGGGSPNALEGAIFGRGPGEPAPPEPALSEPAGGTCEGEWGGGCGVYGGLMREWWGSIAAAIGLASE